MNNDPTIWADFAKAVTEDGPLSARADDAAHARHWRLIVATKLRRLYGRGCQHLALIRELGGRRAIIEAGPARRKSRCGRRGRSAVIPIGDPAGGRGGLATGLCAVCERNGPRSASALPPVLSTRAGISPEMVLTAYLSLTR
jgi:hypothetical protein